MLGFLQVLAWVVTIVSGIIAIYRSLQSPDTPSPYTLQNHTSRRITLGFFGTCLVMLFVAFSLVFFPLRANSPVIAGEGPYGVQQPTGGGTTTPVLALTPTATPPPASTNPYPPYSGSLQINDPLRDNTKGFSWEEGTRDLGTCIFTGGTYHSNIPRSGYFHSCLALSSDFTDFAYEIHMTLTTGSAGGIVFRADRANTHLYYFTVDRTGSYALKAYYDKNGDFNTIASGSGVSFTGSGTIGVVAQGSNVSLYLNRKLLQHVQDGEFTHGQVGGVVYEGEATFSDARIWVLG
jgi:hypothetical protein